MKSKVSSNHSSWKSHQPQVCEEQTSFSTSAMEYIGPTESSGNEDALHTSLRQSQDQQVFYKPQRTSINLRILLLLRDNKISKNRYLFLSVLNFSCTLTFRDVSRSRVFWNFKWQYNRRREYTNILVNLVSRMRYLSIFLFV